MFIFKLLPQNLVRKNLLEIKQNKRTYTLVCWSGRVDLLIKAECVYRMGSIISKNAILCNEISSLIWSNEWMTLKSAAGQILQVVYENTAAESMTSLCSMSGKVYLDSAIISSSPTLDTSPALKR